MTMLSHSGGEPVLRHDRARRMADQVGHALGRGAPDKDVAKFRMRCELAACFIVEDKNGQALAYVYFEDEPGRRDAAHLLASEETRLHGPQLR